MIDVGVTLMFTSTIVVENTLQALRDSSFEFHSTGSRLFGNSVLVSDWDFFVQNDDSIKVWLESNKFRSISNHQYGDSNCVAVYRKHEGATQFDIQVVTDAKMKCDVQKAFIKAHIIPTQIEWNIAFTLYPILLVK